MSRARRRAELLHLFNEVAPIAKTFGMRLAFDGEDRAVVSLPFHPGLDHALGGIHGGVYATLLDTAGWFAAAVRHAESSWMATSEMSVHFLKPCARTSLRAVGRVLKGGKRQDVAEVHLYDGEGELVGHCTATFLLLPHLSLPAAGAASGSRVP